MILSKVTILLFHEPKISLAVAHHQVSQVRQSPADSSCQNFSACEETVPSHRLAKGGQHSCWNRNSSLHVSHSRLLTGGLPKGCLDR
jgi:hypothetical protein